MATTYSSQISLGTHAPDFKLFDTVSEKKLALQELKGRRATLVMFICNHCPYVRHVNSELVKLANDYASEGVSFIAISSNDISQYPEDSPEKMKEVAGRLEYPFPYLFDETQEIARAYDAACTPDFYLFNDDLKLVYHGQLDESRPSNGVPSNGKDLRKALDLLLKGDVIHEDQKPSVGCSIKWKRG